MSVLNHMPGSTAPMDKDPVRSSHMHPSVKKAVALFNPYDDVDDDVAEKVLGPEEKMGQMPHKGGAG